MVVLEVFASLMTTWSLMFPILQVVVVVRVVVTVAVVVDCCCCCFCCFWTIASVKLHTSTESRPLVFGMEMISFSFRGREKTKFEHFVLYFQTF